MFRCCSLEPSHPHLLPQSLKDCSINLCLFFFSVLHIGLLFNMLTRYVIAFLPRSKCLFFSWIQSPSVVILDPKKIKSVTVSIVFPTTCHEVMGLDAIIFIFWVLSFKPDFSLSSFTFTKSLSSSLLSAIRCHLHIWDYWYFSWQYWFQLVLHPAQHLSWYTLHIS